MLKHFVAGILIFLVINPALSVSAFAQTQTNSDNASVKQIKSKVANIFEKHKGRIGIHYLDGTKTKGIVTEVREDSFSLSISKKSPAVSIPYAQIKNVYKTGIPTFAKVLIGVGFVFGLLIVLGEVVAAKGD